MKFFPVSKCSGFKLAREDMFSASQRSLLDSQVFLYAEFARRAYRLDPVVFVTRVTGIEFRDTDSHDVWELGILQYVHGQLIFMPVASRTSKDIGGRVHDVSLSVGFFYNWVEVIIYPSIQGERQQLLHFKIEGECKNAFSYEKHIKPMISKMVSTDRL